MTGPSEQLACARFHQVAAEVFARYGLKSSTRRFSLDEPSFSTRAVEFGSGEPVLLLHGLGLSVVHWTPLIARLERARCVALDMPGHGESDPVSFTGIDLREWHTRMLSGCLDRLGLDAAHVVGHSYGGMFGIWLALDAPERVRSVVCVGTPAVALGARPDVTLRVLSWPLIGPLSLTAPNPGFVYRQIVAASVGRAAVRAAPKQLHRATYLGTRRRGFARTVHTYLREQFAGARATPPRYVLQEDELKRIAVPLLIIWGQDDARYQPIDVAEQRAALIPTSRFERVRGGHEPWLDDLDHCAGLLAGWVDRNPHPLQAAAKSEGSDAAAK
jgi:pimeloyl-ACP methyl ester carboxylesterase